MRYFQHQQREQQSDGQVRLTDLMAGVPWKSGLVVSPASFNEVTRLPVIVLVTSGGQFARSAGFAVSLEGAGTKQQGLFAAISPEPVIWLLGTASDWNVYPTLL
ncbi:MAG: hypothetical protein RSC68_07945 [Acinetobacter sp.]